MAAKSAAAMMVLAVDVIGDGAAQCDELGAGHDWRKEPLPTERLR